MSKSLSPCATSAPKWQVSTIVDLGYYRNSYGEMLRGSPQNWDHDGFAFSMREA